MLNLILIHAHKGKNIISNNYTQLKETIFLKYTWSISLYHLPSIIELHATPLRCRKYETCALTTYYDIVPTIDICLMFDKDSIDTKYYLS